MVYAPIGASGSKENGACAIAEQGKVLKSPMSAHKASMDF
jgi:hypothetical protein